jgi:hypothetical protein
MARIPEFLQTCLNCRWQKNPTLEIHYVREFYTLYNSISKIWGQILGSFPLRSFLLYFFTHLKRLVLRQLHDTSFFNSLHCLLKPIRLSPGVKLQGPESDHLPHYSVDKVDGAIIPLPRTSSWCGVYRFGKRNNIHSLFTQISRTASS